MRASGTEIRQAGRDFFRVIGAFCVCQLCQATLDAVRAPPFFNQHTTDFLGNPNGVQRIPRRKHFLTAAIFPAVTLVPAVNPPPVVIVKDRFLDLHFDELAFFFDHNDQIQPRSPFMETVHVQRPDLPDLIGRQPELCGLICINPQQRKCVQQVEPVFTCRDKADLGPCTRPHDFINPVGPRERFGGEPFVVNHPRLLRNWRIDQTNVQPTLGHRKVWRYKVLHERITVHHAGDFNGVLHRL